MTELNQRLEAIQRREETWQRTLESGASKAQGWERMHCTNKDMPFLLDIVQEQSLALEAAEKLIDVAMTVRIRPLRKESSMSISNEAVEAAAKAMAAAEGFELKPQQVAGDAYRAIARKALEAAMPRLLADTWGDGYLAGLTDMQNGHERLNPYMIHP